jgi:hypothetical protein
MEGYLYKQGSKVKTWQKRWFLVDGTISLGGRLLVSACRARLPDRATQRADVRC